MRSRMLAVLVLGLALNAPAALADSCPVSDFQQGDEPFVFAGGGSYLGVDTRDVTSDRVAPLKLKDETGVEIVAVDQDAPAGKAGLKEKDVILSFNGQKVDSVEQLRRMIREIPPGRQVAVGISRNGQAMNIPVTVGDRKKAMSARVRRGINRNIYVNPMVEVPPMAMMPDVDIPAFNVIVQSSARNGLMVEGLTPQLLEFFGVKGGEGGVLIRSVEKGSAADAAGLRAGDVILRVDKEKIGDVGDWRRAIRNRSGSAQLGIMRDKRELNLQMTFPERKNRETGTLIGPDDVNFTVDLQDLQAELERMRPEIERTTREISMNLQKELSVHGKQIAKAMADSQKEAAKAIREHSKEIEKAQKELEKELSKHEHDNE